MIFSREYYSVIVQQTVSLTTKRETDGGVGVEKLTYRLSVVLLSVRPICLKDIWSSLEMKYSILSSLFRSI